MIIVLLIVGVLVFGGVVVFAVFGGLIKVESDQKKAESNAGEILDTAFDGRSDVAFNIHLRSLTYETVVLGAKARGYRLTNPNVSQTGAYTLLFEKSGALSG